MIAHLTSVTMSVHAEYTFAIEQEEKTQLKKTGELLDVPDGYAVLNLIALCRKGVTQAG